MGMSTERTEMLPHVRVTTGRNKLIVGKASFPLLDWDLSGTTYRPGLTEDDSYIYIYLRPTLVKKIALPPTTVI